MEKLYPEMTNHEYVTRNGVYLLELQQVDKDYNFVRNVNIRSTGELEKSGNIKTNLKEMQEKFMSKMVTFSHDLTAATCPNCGEMLDLDLKCEPENNEQMMFKYCPYCEQKLNWEDWIKEKETYNNFK